MLSICQDAVFKAFCTLISQTKSIHTWELVLYSQAYPNPQELLCDQNFHIAIAQTEPGIQIDYQRLHDDGLQISSTPDQRLRIAKLCNNLDNARRHYEQARTYVEGYTLYDKMIDRFYRKVVDHAFQRFVVSNNHGHAQAIWPKYETIKQANRVKLDNWLKELQICTVIVHDIKSSATTKHFLRQLDSVRQARKLQSMDVPAIPALTSKPALTLAERKRAIERRNRMTQRARQRANEGLRLQNKHNIHQIGEQGRYPNPDMAIATISRMQKAFKNKQTEVSPSDLYWYKGLLEESGMKAPLVELALEEAKAALEADLRVDMSEKLVLAKGFSNIAGIGQEVVEEDNGGQ